MLEHLETYIQAQKTVASLFMLIGGLLFLLAIAAHFAGKTDLLNGLKYGAIVCGLLILLGGLGYRATESKLLEKQTSLYQQSEQRFQQEEYQRMENVVKSYPTYQWTFAALILISLLVILFTTKPFWHGVAFAVMLLHAAVLLVEAVSHRSIMAYFNVLGG